MSGHRTARLALGSVAVVVAVSASACVSSAVCSSDADCAAFGEGSVCVRGERPEGLCTDGDLTPNEVTPPLLDAGPPKDDGGPDQLTIDLTLQPESVTAGDPVTLEWQAPAAVSCSVSAQASHEAEPHPVDDAPTGAAGEANVNVMQDTTFTVTCQGEGGARTSRSEAVDVATSGTLAAENANVNWQAPVTLTWQTFGAQECAILDDTGSVVHAIGSAELLTGSITPDATSPRFGLSCDGAEVDAVDLTLASLGNLIATPAALGPEPEEVTLSWDYTGPGGCGVFLNGSTSAAVDEDGVPTNGAQITLAGDTDVEVACDGFGTTLRATLDVPRLITSFTGPGAPVEHGADVTLAYAAAPDADCAIFDDADPSGAPVETPVQDIAATTTYRLDCSLDGRTASAFVEVLVLPAEPLLRGELLPGDTSVPVLSLVVETSPNALECELLSTGPTPSLSTGPAAGAFTAEVATDALSDGTVSYQARCFAGSERSLPSVSASLQIHVGDVDADTLGDVGTASLLVGNVMLSNETTFTSSALSALAGVRQLSGNLLVQSVNHGEFDNLDALRLERVVGNVTIDDNTYLNRLSVDVAGDVGDKGLAWLREVYGDLVIEQNTNLDSGRFPRLTTVGGDLRVYDNDALDTLSFPLLEGTRNLTLDANEDLDDADGAAFAALKDIGGDLIVSRSDIIDLSGYFPSLQSVTGNFGISLNGAMTCESIAAVLCGLSAEPTSAAVSGNTGTCPWGGGEPTCSAP